MPPRPRVHWFYSKATDGEVALTKGVPSCGTFVPFSEADSLTLEVSASGTGAPIWERNAARSQPTQVVLMCRAPETLCPRSRTLPPLHRTTTVSLHGDSAPAISCAGRDSVGKAGRGPSYQRSLSPAPDDRQLEP